MKIDTVILSSDDNQDYIEFWPIVSEAWKLMGLEPILIYTGKTKPKLNGNIIHFYNEKIDSAFVAQNIRILYPGLLKNKNCIVSDIDNMPLSKKYFINSVKELDSQSFVIYRPDACPPNMISMMWNAASSQTWNEIFKVNSEKDINKLLKRWYTNKYSIRGKAWYTDQIKLRKYINKFERKNKDRVILLNDNSTGFNRFNRNKLQIHLNQMKKGEIYTDFHMPRPYSEFKEEIQEVFDFHRQYIIN